MEAQLQLNDIAKALSLVVRILGVWVDSQLRWGEHVKKTLYKMKT